MSAVLTMLTAHPSRSKREQQPRRCVHCLRVLQSQGGHHHHREDAVTSFSEGHHLHEEAQEESLDGVWKGLTALSGVYFMFLIEHFLTLGKMYKDKKQKLKVPRSSRSSSPPFFFFFFIFLLFSLFVFLVSFISVASSFLF